MPHKVWSFTQTKFFIWEAHSKTSCQPEHHLHVPLLRSRWCVRSTGVERCKTRLDGIFIQIQVFLFRKPNNQLSLSRLWRNCHLQSSENKFKYFFWSDEIWQMLLIIKYFFLIWSNKYDRCFWSSNIWPLFTQVTLSTVNVRTKAPLVNLFASGASSQKNSMQNLRKCKIKIKMKSLFGEGKIGNLEWFWKIWRRPHLLSGEVLEYRYGQRWGLKMKCELKLSACTVISVIMQRPNFYRKYATSIFDSSFLLILS